MTDTILLLGTFAFSGSEVPPELSSGGDQAMAVQKLIGGTRVVDAMGPDPAPVTWSGRLQGPQAESRLRTLEAMRDKGEKVSLSWGAQRKSVVIKSVRYRWERFYQILYSIECEVVEDSASLQAAGALGFGSKISDLIGKDALDALGLSDLIGDATLGSAMSDLQGAVSIAGAITGSSKIAAIGGYLSTAQNAAGSLFSIANGNVVGGALSLTGVVGRSAGAAFGSQAGIMAQLANTNQAQNLLGRIGINLGRAT